MLSRLDLDMALTGNVEVARDMRDIAQEKMALMKRQIQVMQNKTLDERTAATSSTDTSSSPLDKHSTPNLPIEVDGDDATEATEATQDDSANNKLQGVGGGAAAQPAQDLPGVPVDAG